MKMRKTKTKKKNKRKPEQKQQCIPQEPHRSPQIKICPPPSQPNFKN
jgi:hypothetical protein